MTPKEQALALVQEFGWYVFRLEISHNPANCDGGKKSCKTVHTPMSGGYRESWKQVSSNDPDVVDKWNWGTTSVNAYGIDCGKSGIVVVDQDPHASWPFKAGRIHSTGRGKHYIYEDLLGLDNRTSLLPWHVDIRAVGGMIIGPGSWHPHGKYEILVDAPPGTPPPELVKAMDKPINKPDASSEGPLDPLEALDRMNGVYYRMGATPDGQRNDMLNKLAGVAAGLWVRLEPEHQTGALDEDFIKHKLLMSIPFDGDPQKSMGTIENGWTYGLDHPMGDRPDIKELQDQIFDATPTLNHIRQAAYASGRSAMPMLCAVLARVLAEIPPECKLPGAEDGVMGRRSSLNLAFAFTGVSGSGKTDISENSEKVLGVDQSFIQKSPSSGEGLIGTFLRKDPDTKMLTMIDDPRRLFNVDEVGSLKAVSDRQGATIGANLRAMLTGGHVGTENADETIRRNLPSGSYRMVLQVGVQPRLSGILLKDEDAGLPQRFVWVEVLGGDVPHPDTWPDWPGSLDWKPPALVFGNQILDYPDWLKKKIKMDDWEKAKSGDQRTSHRNLTGLKVAAALAFLHNDLKITDQWWEIANLILEISDNVQADCRRALAAGDRANAEYRGRMEALTKLAMDETREDELTIKTAKNVIRHLKPEGVAFSDLRRSLSRPQRNHIDAALNLLAKRGEIKIEEVDKGKRILPS